MSDRREFTRTQKAQIVHRAMLKSGQIQCEKCGFVLGAKIYEIDHRVPEALVIDKTKPLTIADGWLLGLDCCHRPKTAIDKGTIARAVRREARHLGIRKPSSFPKRPPGYVHDWKRGGRLVREDQ